MILVLGLGTNRGNRIGNLRAALYKLAKHSSVLRVLKSSPVYESDAMLKPGAPADWNQPYLNMAIACESSADPFELLDLLKSTEREMGRANHEPWAPRLIDIDILDWEGKTIESDRLKIPHAGLEDRPFALLPMTDLFSDHRRWNAAANRWRFARTLDEIPFRTRRIPLGLTELAGILNITPDSFSDGGLLYGSSQAVLSQARRLVAGGATILDIGAESTRPGALAVSPDDEWKRLEALLPLLKEEFPGITLSIDTRHAQTAKRAIAAGADWINDVTGFDSPEMRKVVASSNVQVVAMHHLGVPPSRDHTLPLSDDPIATILEWGESKIAQLTRDGIDLSRIILDAGIGFGKTPQQTFSLFERMHLLRNLGAPILVGHSRKSFMTAFTDRASSDRDLETAALSLRAAQQGVDYLRVHDAECNARVLKAGLLTVRDFPFR